jgi:hypothetical protein
MAIRRLTKQQKRDIFRELVSVQDSGNAVRKSRELMMEKFEISDNQLKEIEDEGLEEQWPPLNEAMQEVG